MWFVVVSNRGVCGFVAGFMVRITSYALVRTHPFCKASILRIAWVNRRMELTAMVFLRGRWTDWDIQENFRSLFSLYTGMKTSEFTQNALRESHTISTLCVSNTGLRDCD